MRVHVWDALDMQPDDGLFPFNADQIQKFRIDTGGEPRPFLQSLNAFFERWLDGQPSPTKPLVLTSVSPQEVPSDEPTPLLLKGEHLPLNVVVTFDGTPSPQPAVCRPGNGEIDVTPPTGLVGDVTVAVQAAENADNNATITLRFTREPEPMKPYWKVLDAGKFKSCRVDLMTNFRTTERPFTQAWVAEQVGLTPSQLGRLENNRWLDAEDDLYEKFADLYGRPLRDFLKDA